MTPADLALLAEARKLAEADAERERDAAIARAERAEAMVEVLKPFVPSMHELLAVAHSIGLTSASDVSVAVARSYSQRSTAAFDVLARLAPSSGGAASPPSGDRLALLEKMFAAMKPVVRAARDFDNAYRTPAQYNYEVALLAAVRAFYGVSGGGAE